MSSLLGRSSVPAPSDPATMPDEEDPAAVRARRAALARGRGPGSSRVNEARNTGQEYSRGTLG